MTPNSATPGDAVALSLEEGAAAIRALLAPGETSLLIAVSGGPDSLVLMHAAAHLARIAPAYRVAVACVDHGLRRESASEAQAVARQAESLALACRILRWEETPKPRHGLQEAARRARYALLAQEASRIGAQAVLTAHTCDDQAETVLMRIAAGSGIDGLAGMAARTPLTSGTERRIMLARPFLGIAKSRLLAACTTLDLSPVRDPSNTDPRFARARLRQSMTALAAEGLTARRLVRLGARARQAREGLDFAGEMLFRSARSAAGADGAAHAGGSARPVVSLDARSLTGAPPALLMRVLTLALAQLSELAPHDSGSRPDISIAAERVGQIRLARLENLANALHEALASGCDLKARTLAGARFVLSDDAILQISPAPERRRGPSSSCTGRGR